MKVVQVAETVYNARKFIPGIERINGNAVRRSVNSLNAETNTIPVPKFIKRLVNLFRKPKDFDVVESPIIARMDSYYDRIGDITNDRYLEPVGKGLYGTVDEKLAEIYMNQSQVGLPSTILQQNIEAMGRVPEEVKMLLKPQDITYDGHVDQQMVNKAYAMAKKAGKISQYEYAPYFAGKLHEPSELSAEIITPNNKLEAIDSRFNIFEDAGSGGDAISEHLEDITVGVHDLISETVASEVTENIFKKAGDFLENLLD